MLKEKINKYINIQMGLVLSRAGTKKAGDPDEKFNKHMYKSITLRSIDEFGKINLNFCDKFICDVELTERYLTKENDILIRLFTPMKACLIDKSQTNLVVPSQFAIIRINENYTKRVLPEYIHLIMQNKDFINQVEKLEEGFQLRSIKTSSIENVEITIPSIEKQEKLIKIAELMNKKEVLYNNLFEQQKLQNEIILNNLIKGDK